MPFGISSSDRKGWFSTTLFKKNLVRFWPLWALYGLFWLFQIPVKIFLTYEYASMEYQADQFRIALGQSGTCIGAGYGLLLAMALFSYLMNTRSAGMLHALPIRREGLFLTNFVSGFVFIAGPTLTVALITLLLQACNQVWMPGGVFQWFVLNLMITLMYFAFAVCCAMFTGNILALPVFYIILNNLAWGINELLKMAAVTLLFGWRGATPQFISLCTPTIFFAQSMAFSSEYYNNGDYNVGIMPTSFLNIVCYSLVLFCVFTAIAVLTYRRRQLERAGDVVTVGWVRPIFQYGVGVCVGLALGAFLYHSFFRGIGSWAYIVCVALCAMVGAFGAKMLLKKSLRVFGEWKGPTALFFCMLLVMGGLWTDILGIAQKVPNIEQVECIHLGGITVPEDDGKYLQVTAETANDSELARQILELHKALVADPGRSQRSHDFEMRDEKGYQTEAITSVYIRYILKNGGELTRYYNNLPISTDELSDPDSYAARLQNILNDPEVLRENYVTYDKTDMKAVGGAIENYDSRMSVKTLELSDEEAGRLWDAFQEDLDAGRVRRYLLDSRERMENCYYYNNLTLQVAVRPVNGDYHIRTVEVTPEKSMTSLMAVMKELGLDQYLSNREGVAD